MSRFAGWLFFVLALVVSSSALAAGKKPLHVLIIQSEDAVEQAQALTIALKRAATRSTKYALADGEFSLEVMSLALGCSDPPDGTCLAQLAAKLRSDQYIWGTMQRDGSKVIVHLRLWRRGDTGSEITARYSSSLSEPDDDALAELAATLFARLSGEQPPSSTASEPFADPADDAADDADDDEPMGELVVFADDVDGSVIIDGRSFGRIKNGYAKVQVPAGEHEIVVRAGGYHEAIADVDVRANRRSEVRLYPERRDRPRRRTGAGEEEESQAGAGWAAIAVGGVMVGGGVYSAIKVRSINEDPDYAGYRAQFRQNENVCTEAERGTVKDGQAPPGEIEDLCSQARTFEALQYLFFGLGGVAIGTGALILITDSASDSSPESDRGDEALRPEPRVAVSKGGAEIGLRLRF